MKSTNIYHEMALERCRLYVAQLFAVYYCHWNEELDAAGQKPLPEKSVESLLMALNQDIEFLEGDVSDLPCDT